MADIYNYINGKISIDITCVGFASARPNYTHRILYSGNHCRQEYAVPYYSLQLSAQYDFCTVEIQLLHAMDIEIVPQ